MLSLELELFWKWAKISPYQYAKGEYPSHIMGNPWEYEYPRWKYLEASVIEEIILYNKKPNDRSVQLILQALAIDSESEGLLDRLVLTLNMDAQIHFTISGSKFYMSNARWQVAEFIMRSDISIKSYWLEKMIVNDEDKYVQRRALLSLESIDVKLTEKYAFQKILDEDEYLRLVSLRLLKELGAEKLAEAQLILKNDPSDLIQDELLRQQNE